MFPLAMPMLIGGGLGLLANKKDPLKGALMGAGLGAAGGAIAPQMAGGLLGSAAPIDPTTVQGVSALMGDTSAFASPQVGLLGQAAKFSKDAAPVMNAVSTGLSVAGQGQEPPVQGTPPTVGQGGAQGLNGLLSTIQQTQAAQMQAEEQKRAARRAALRGGLL